MTVTPEQRQRWQEARAALDEIERERDELRRAAVAHLDERYEAADAAFDAIDDEINGEVSRCVGCREPIFPGDRYSSGEDDHFCFKCSPTWRDIQEHPEYFLDSEGEYHTPESVAPRIAAHLAAGGSLDDSMANDVME